MSAKNPNNIESLCPFGVTGFRSGPSWLSSDLSSTPPSNWKTASHISFFVWRENSSCLTFSLSHSDKNAGSAAQSEFSSMASGIFDKSQFLSDYNGFALWLPSFILDWDLTTNSPDFPWSWWHASPSHWKLATCFSGIGSIIIWGLSWTFHFLICLLCISEKDGMWRY